VKSRFRSCQPARAPVGSGVLNGFIQPTGSRMNRTVLSSRSSRHYSRLHRRWLQDTGQCIKGAAGLQGCKAGCKEDSRPRRTPASTATTIVSRRREVRADRRDATGFDDMISVQRHATARSESASTLPEDPTGMPVSTTRR
jgi:hypothetical protein